MSKKILVADDDILFRRILCRKLSKSLDVVVDQVSSVSELIESTTQYQYGLILTDQDMGDLLEEKGTYAIRLIRELGYEGPIIIHSSFMSSELEEEAFNSGVDCALSKMDYSCLVDKIKEYLI